MRFPKQMMDYENSDARNLLFFPHSVQLYDELGIANYTTSVILTSHIEGDQSK